eukprot:TRINITY_DN26032_c0_g1_i2.p1 TRINITY_DN26032_c0_g1~~TRINITY_DN26032_c0_g1_i2.p1  ORF type:complete len:575 (-),score=132.28 TRINITY_DN26032_c0_g1_i2:108-1832(-)
MNYAGRDFLLNLYTTNPGGEPAPRYYTQQEDNHWESSCFNPLMRATDGAWRAPNYQLPKVEHLSQSLYNYGNQQVHQSSYSYNPGIHNPTPYSAYNMPPPAVFQQNSTVTRAHPTGNYQALESLPKRKREDEYVPNNPFQNPPPTSTPSFNSPLTTNFTFNASTSHAPLSTPNSSTRNLNYSPTTSFQDSPSPSAGDDSPLISPPTSISDDKPKRMKHSTNTSHISSSTSSNNTSSTTPSVLNEFQGEEKLTEKSKRSREASKRYRQRKKAVMEQMKDELAALIKEKSDLENEKQKALEIIDKLKRENSILRRKQLDDANYIERERVTLISELEKIMSSGSDEELAVVVNKIKPYCHRIHQLAQEILSRFLNSDVVNMLAKSGYFNSDFGKVEDASSSASLNYVVRSIVIPLLSSHQLTDQQRMTMIEGLDKYYVRLAEIKEERQDLFLELLSTFGDNPFIGTKTEGNAPSGMKNVLKATALLECFRNNLAKESSACYDCLQDVIVNPLTPRQLGTFFLKIEFLHKSVQQLKGMWEALRAAGTILADERELPDLSGVQGNCVSVSSLAFTSPFA